MEGLVERRSPGEEQPLRSLYLAVDTRSPSRWGRGKACTPARAPHTTCAEHARKTGEMRTKLQISKEPWEANKEAPDSRSSNQGPISTTELLISS